MSLATPKKWAIRITKILNAVQQLHPDISHFPVNVALVAKELSNSLYPKEPITMIHGDAFSSSFEGALIPSPKKNGEWAILYNNLIKSSGRINFTLAHEFGHYLQHRHLFTGGKHCTRQEMLQWQSKEMVVETEANIFAANLLMPLADFSKSIYRRDISRELIFELASKYQTSVAATALRWLEITNIPAMMISAKDGFIDWAWSNSSLFKAGIYLKPKQQVLALPPASLAMDSNHKNFVIEHKSGIWPGNVNTKEIILSKNEEHSLLLLIYPKMINTDKSSRNTNEELLQELSFR